MKEQGARRKFFFTFVETGHALSLLLTFYCITCEFHMTLNRKNYKYMNKVTLNIPENINLNTFDFSVYVASKMYEDGLVSARQASEMVGISKRAFVEILGKYGVSLFSQSLEDLDKDIANA